MIVLLITMLAFGSSASVCDTDGVDHVIAGNVVFDDSGNHYVTIIWCNEFGTELGRAVVTESFDAYSIHYGYGPGDNCSVTCIPSWQTSCAQVDPDIDFPDDYEQTATGWVHWSDFK